MTVTSPSTSTDSSATEAHAGLRVSLPQPPRIVRPHGLPRAAVPGDVPAPEHHHLPGWVKRVYGQARPILGDLLGGLEGEARTNLQNRIDVLTTGINAGKFSLAWNYPRIIDDGHTLYQRSRQENAELFRQRRTIELARRKVANMLRDGAAKLGAETNARFTKEMRGANDLEAIASLETEVKADLAQARSAGERRRDREIDRTRQRILKTIPKSAASVAPQESWQDVLRRFAESQKAE